MLLWTLELQKCTQLPTTSTNCFWQLPHFVLSLYLPTNTFIFLPANCLWINAWSSQLVQPITTSLWVHCITKWKHFTSSLWMNDVNFIFQLFHIHNFPTLVVLTPPHSPCTPSTNYAHLSANYFNSFVDYDNTSIDCTNFSIDHANKFDDCAKMPNDRANTSIDSANTHDKSSSDFCIPNPSLLLLLFTNLLIIC